MERSHLQTEQGPGTGPEKGDQHPGFLCEVAYKERDVISQDQNKARSISLTDVEVEGIISGFSIVAERQIFDDGNNRSRPGTIYVLLRIPKEDLVLR